MTKRNVTFRSNARNKALLASMLLWPVVLIGCEEQLPVGVGDGALPGEPVTVEITIPWDEFASNLEVFGGYGSARDLGIGVLANQFADTLDARTLMRFAAYPQVATVRDSTGTNRPDSTLTFVGGRLVAFLDTVASTNTAPVTLAVGALQQEWDPQTVSWTNAVDTINDQRAWTEPGAGPALAVDTAVWDPAEGDSIVFAIDSATISAWGETGDLTTGARIDLVDAGSRLQVRSAALRLDVRPSLDPDTLIELSAQTELITFIYSPFPEPPPDGVRIGGAPSWRTVLDVSIPQTITGPASFCAVVSCPHTIAPVEISSASLVLTSRTTEAAFQPTDSIRLDVRPVLDRSAMPKSPLGESLIETLFGRPVGPDAFGSSAGVSIEVPFTGFARDLVRGTDEDGNPAPDALALLSVIEPISIAFASFEGPGTADEPVLRLVLTIGPPVELP
ncbi:MAG: hypothetical protein AAF389_16240 [Gemmatimonadota bacterium]